MMIRVDRFVNIKELSKIGAWVKEQGFVKYLILCLVVIYFLASYKSLYLAWYDENVMPIISLFVSNILVNLLTIILIVINISASAI